MNIRSLRSKLPIIEILLGSLTNAPDVIVFTETWLTPVEEDSIKINGYYCYNITRKDREHGGVSIYIKENIESTLLEEFTVISLDIEICTISVTISNKTFIIAAIYRPRSKQERIKEFRDELVNFLKCNKFKKSKVIVIGDLNINLLEHIDHSPTNEFLNFMQTFNFLPLITRPTRFPEGNQIAVPSL